MDNFPNINEGYTKIILPKNNDKKYEELKKYLEKIVMGKFNSDREEYYMPGVLHQNKKGDLTIKIRENKRVYSKPINLDNLEEIFIKKEFM